MLDDAERLLTALKWHGVAMVEFKMDARGQYWLMEINPRLWGSLALSIDAGVDFPAGLLQIACGQQLAAQPQYKIHYYTRDLRTDIDWLKSNLRADPQDPLLHTKSRSFSFLELLRPLTGRESWATLTGTTWELRGGRWAGWPLTSCGQFIASSKAGGWKDDN